MPETKEAKIVEGKDGKLKLENFYTPLEEAKKEIWRRWKDEKLKKKVRKYLKGDLLERLKGKPKAVLARYINTPDNEFFRFLELADKAKLIPVCPEYQNDKFIPENKDKYYLGKIYFHDGNGHNGGGKISALKIVDFSEARGEKIKDIKTIWGENLADFHHNLLRSATLKEDYKIFDASDWIDRKGKNPKKYYSQFLALFVCYGILFESYLNTSDEKEFLRNIFLPNFKKVTELFGVKPLVVRLLPQNEENDLFWSCFPERTKKLIRIMTIPK